MSENVHVNVPTTVQGMASSAYSSPEFTRYMQQQIQEAVRRYAGLNPNNGIPKEPDVSKDGRKPEVISWETVAVTALPPGWHNVFTVPGDRLHRKPCPAILLQENRGSTVTRDLEDAQGNPHVSVDYVDAEPPYETRTVFADYEGPHLWAADDGDDYLCTIGPGEE